MRDAYLAAADWLEAHPDQHMAGGRVIRPDGDEPKGDEDPDTLCYCAAGRIAVELGLPATEDGTRCIIGMLGTMQYQQIARVNDDGDLGYLNEDLNIHRGNPEVIAFLRELAGG